MKKSILVHLNLPDDIVKELDFDVSKGKFRDRTDAIIQLVKFARDVSSHLHKLEDPEVVKKLRDAWTTKRLDEFSQSLSDNDRRYLNMYLEMIKTGVKVC